MTDVPRLSVGLPVYNGESYLAETLDSLLDQSFTDFELIISDNASTDGTEEICRRYAARDPRIRYVRQPRNIGANPNHNFVLREARGEYFKWAAHDDLYGCDLLVRCVAALDEHPDVVLSHVDKAIIDEAGTVVQKFDYTLATDSTDVRERFRSLVVADGADDEYGVIRTHVLRSIRPKDSYHHASRPFMVEIAFRGRFHQVRELLYFRRDHPDRGDRNPTIPALCTNLDPRRAGQSTARLLAEYAWRFFEAIARAPISPAEKWACYRILLSHLIRSGIHRVISRSGDPLFGSSRPATPGDATAMHHEELHVMTAIQSVDAMSGSPRAGDVVRVRSREEILATLDANGRLDGQPFMPEMLQFAGRELPVSKVAHKTCDTINRPSTGMRRLDRTVHLADARCDGSAHGGCQAGCLLFWREEWLETPEGIPLRVQPPELSPVATEQTLHDDTVAGVDDDGATLYRCAATELGRASSPLPSLEPGQYVADVRSGNYRARFVIRGLLILLFNKFQALSRKLLPQRLRIADGLPYPFVRGTGPGPKPEPLRLQPGELVEVKSKDEIMAALGPNGKNRGLIFDVEMLPYCGRRARVLKSVEKIIEENTGRMLRLRDCVILDQVICVGRYHRFCPRAIHIYWREAWLRRVD